MNRRLPRRKLRLRPRIASRPRSISKAPSAIGFCALPRMRKSPPSCASRPLPRTKIRFAAVSLISRRTVEASGSRVAHRGSACESTALKFGRVDMSEFKLRDRARQLVGHDHVEPLQIDVAGGAERLERAGQSDPAIDFPGHQFAVVELHGGEIDDESGHQRTVPFAARDSEPCAVIAPPLVLVATIRSITRLDVVKRALPAMPVSFSPLPASLSVPSASRSAPSTIGWRVCR